MKQFAKTVAAVVLGILIAFFLIRVYLAYKVHSVIQEMNWEDNQDQGRKN